MQGPLPAEREPAGLLSRMLGDPESRACPSESGPGKPDPQREKSDARFRADGHRGLDSQNEKAKGRFEKQFQGVEEKEKITTGTPPLPPKGVLFAIPGEMRIMTPLKRPSPNWIERRTTDAKVAGSNPAGRALFLPCNLFSRPRLASFSSPQFFLLFVSFFGSRRHKTGRHLPF